MKVDSVLSFAHILLERVVKTGGIAVDCTMGNGYDTLFLAALTGPTGHVFSFDIQQEAFDFTREKVCGQGVEEQVTLFQTGHQFITEAIPTAVHGKINGAIFNLGYLPGGDKSITTRPSTTISAIEQLLELMTPEGIIVLVIYHGHPGGETERNEVMDYVTHLSQDEAHVLHYSFPNQKNSPPFLVAIEKRS